MPGAWLVKTEPLVYAIGDLRRDRETAWDRVRNHQAKLMLRDGMATGDPVLIYHSNADPTGVVGLAEVAGEAVPDATQFRRGDESFEPRATPEAPVWWARPLRFRKAFKACVELSTLRDTPGLADLPLLRRGNRLSVMPVSARSFRIILRLAGG